MPALTVEPHTPLFAILDLIFDLSCFGQAILLRRLWICGFSENHKGEGDLEIHLDVMNPSSKIELMYGQVAFVVRDMDKIIEGQQENSYGYDALDFY